MPCVIPRLLGYHESKLEELQFTQLIESKTQPQKHPRHGVVGNQNEAKAAKARARAKATHQLLVKCGWSNGSKSGSRGGRII